MAHVWTATLSGVHGLPVEVEVRLSSQLPRVDVVGLPEAAVRESTSRIRGAISASGGNFPDRRVTINLAPADLRKNGAGLDLPIAVGVLAAAGDLDPEAVGGRGFIGELALDGRLRITKGSLAAVLAMRQMGLREAIVPSENANQACQAPGIQVLAASNLGEVVRHLRGEELLTPSESRAADPAEPHEAVCMSDVRGQPFAKRALEIAAAGGHGLLFSGPPGTGKTLLAKRLPGLLPLLGEIERLEVFCILDASGIEGIGSRIPHVPPFRSPHHSASPAGLLGGGSPIRPGEVTLAHRGVLFLDELPEFDRRCLESLREILEQGVVRISRAQIRTELPARFQLIAAANPCPCGYFGTPDRDCRCDDAALARYRRRLSGPLLDRIDLNVRVGDVSWRELEAPASGPTSEEIRVRVARARKRQADRHASLEREYAAPRSGFRHPVDSANRAETSTNATLPDRTLDESVRASTEARNLLGRAVDRARLSARGTRRVLRVARTIADLGDRECVGPQEIAEALALRGLL